MPKTTTFAAGQCQVVLSAPTPAYTSNTIGGQPSGQIAAGTYEVGVAAQYSIRAEQCGHGELHQQHQRLVDQRQLHGQ